MERESIESRTFNGKVYKNRRGAHLARKRAAKRIKKIEVEARELRNLELALAKEKLEDVEETRRIELALRSAEVVPEKHERMMEQLQRATNDQLGEDEERLIVEQAMKLPKMPGGTGPWAGRPRPLAKMEMYSS